MTTVQQSPTSPQLTCIECGELLGSAQIERRICDRCFAAFRVEMVAYSAEQERQRQLWRELEAWARECSLPQPKRAGCLILNGSSFGAEWSEYILEILSVRQDATDYPPPWPYYQIGPLTHRVYARRLRHRNVDAYADMRFSIDGEPMIAIRGLEHDSVNQDHVKLLYRGLKLIRMKRRGGRELGSGQYPTPQAFHAAYFKVMKYFAREYIRPKAALIADELCLSESRYYDLLKQWPPEEPSP
ncbi:MAG: hypothetical protein ACJ789_12985 [Thermomicrobiales bacterium]